MSNQKGKKKTAKKGTLKIPSIREIEKFVEDAGSDHVQTFGGVFEGGWQVQQIPDEIAPCINAILKTGQKINTYLEIGVAAGGTTALMHHFLKPETIVLIDDNKHPKHHARKSILKNIKRTEIIGDAHSEKVIADLSKKGICFDLILIDGDHSYEGCRMDVENYTPFLQPSGFVVFHDSFCQFCPGVGRVVSELKENPDFSLIGDYITQKHRMSCGVSLFRKDVTGAKEKNENK